MSALKRWSVCSPSVARSISSAVCASTSAPTSDAYPRTVCSATNSHICAPARSDRRAYAGRHTTHPLDGDDRRDARDVVRAVHGDLRVVGLRGCQVCSGHGRPSGHTRAPTRSAAATQLARSGFGASYSTRPPVYAYDCRALAPALALAGYTESRGFCRNDERGRRDMADGHTRRPFHPAHGSVRTYPGPNAEYKSAHGNFALSPVSVPHRSGRAVPRGGEGRHFAWAERGVRLRPNAHKTERPAVRGLSPGLTLRRLGRVRCAARGVIFCNRPYRPLCDPDGLVKP
jgi:hypothetical protein